MVGAKKDKKFALKIVTRMCDGLGVRYAVVE
jgi:hypothetical protein